MGHASLIELSAQGVENVDLTVDAQHTFFKTVYSKHTGYAMEPKELQFSSGTADYGATGTVKIDRQGDMISESLLVFEVAALNDGYHFTNDLGRALISKVAVNIGGVIYDTRQGEYMHIWEEISQTPEQVLGEITLNAKNTAQLQDWAPVPHKLYVPIRFWFTDAYSNSLPLVALFQHDVQLEFKFRTFAELVVAEAGFDAPTNAGDNGGALTNMVLLVEYVFLENNERNYFARGTHKYMIEQVQFVGTTSLSAGVLTSNIDLHFNHPTNELIWASRKASNGGANKDYFNFDGDEVEPFLNDSFASNRLLLNNSDRWEARDPIYFRGIMPHRVHTKIPEKRVYCYAFALHPEQSGTEPSGNINFSRIDSSQFRFTYTVGLTENYDFFLWARSVNWLKVERGLSKLYFA